MITLVFLLVVWAPCIIARVVSTHGARTLSDNHPRSPRAMPEDPGTNGATDRSPLAWSALDDRQLTRLLTDSARRPITE